MDQFPLVDTADDHGKRLIFIEPGWREARGHIDFLVHIDTPTDAVMRRLATRHEAFGKCRADATHWVRTVDAPNIELVAECASRADAIISPQSSKASKPQSLKASNRRVTVASCGQRAQ